MMSKNIPFSFVFDYLATIDITVKPMFGMFGVYVDEKILLILRQRKDHPDTNGVWIATQTEHHKSLKKELPSMCSISTYSDGIQETEWQVLPATSDDFEPSVIKVCNMITRGDPRIGRIPKAGKKSRQ